MEPRLKRLTQLFIIGGLGALVAGCGSTATSPPVATTVVPPGQSSLEVAVGTANFAGTEGLNVTATLRTTTGKSVLLDTPSVAGPLKMPAYQGSPDGNDATIQTGPTADEQVNGAITGTAQNATNPTTFGLAGLLTANGYMPANSGNVGQPFLTPYEQPLYDPSYCPPSAGPSSCAPDPNAFFAWGGPPAFDPNGNGQGTRDGTFNGGVLGVQEGINAFLNTIPGVGTYTGSVGIPTQAKTITITKSYKMTHVTLLPAATPPLFTPDGSGGGTFEVLMPPGATDGLLQVIDLGPGGGGVNCYLGGSPPAWFTIHVTSSGPATLPDSDGVGNPKQHTPTLCTAAQNAAAGNPSGGADVFSVQLIAADYPIYASQYLFTQNTPAPNIYGNGANDISISAIGTGSPSSSPADLKMRAQRLHALLFARSKTVGNRAL